MIGIVHIPWIHKAQSSYEGALYAALDIIGGGNPSLAQELHDSGGTPPFSACLEKGCLRIGALRTDVLMAIHRSPVAHKVVVVADPVELGMLLDTAVTTPTIKLRFESPTSFSVNRNSHCLPEPRLVFGSLARRWERVGGQPMPDLQLDRACVIHAQVHVQKAETRRFVQFGAVGHILVKVPDAVARYYHALAMFAEYAGCGERTAWGFGRTAYVKDEGVMKGRNGRRFANDGRQVVRESPLVVVE